LTGGAGNDFLDGFRGRGSRSEEPWGYPRFPYITVTIAVENISDTRKELVVTVPAATWPPRSGGAGGDREAGAAPGFRPGKAPMEMVRKRYAKEIDEELHRKVAGRPTKRR